MKKVLYTNIILLTIISWSFVACSDKDTPYNPTAEVADLAVFGTIFTSEDTDTVSAFAVKDGKYIYVGDRAGVEKYIGKQTTIIDHTDKGMVMAGCTEGHGHYMMDSFYKNGRFIVNIKKTDSHDQILDSVAAIAKKNPTYVYGFGFDYMKLSNEHAFPTRHELDSIMGKVPTYLADSEGHKGIANTACFEKADILDEYGKVKSDFKYKDYVDVDTNGYPTGLLLEQAGTYVRVRGCIPDDDTKVWKACLQDAQTKLNSMGYTAAFEGWANKFGMKTYDAAKEMDNNDSMTINLGMAYEIENLTTAEVDNQLNDAIKAANDYTSSHIHPNFIKLFEDGTAESGTGYMLIPYEGKNGKPIWEPETLTRLTTVANDHGLTMHVHAMGDAAVREVIDAFENSGGVNKGIRNQMVHLRNVAKSDYERMARNNIVASSGVLWHWMLPGIEFYVSDVYVLQGYPYHSFTKNNIHTSIHTDAPAANGSPTDPFGIMEIAVTATYTFNGYDYSTPWDKDERANRKEFLRSLTIEGAYQMYTEKTRGSIAVGKYADFILIDQDVLRCDEKQLHNTKVLKTYFEGKCVYETPKL